MALAAEVSDLSTVPEALRTEYTKHGDTYVLNVLGMKPEKEFDDLKIALNKRLADTASELKLLKDSNVTREELLEVIRKSTASDNNDGDGKGADAKKLADVQRELEAAKQRELAVTKERDEAVTARTGLTRDTAIARAVSASAPRPEVATTVSDIVSRYVEVASDGSVKTKIDCEFGPDLTPDQLMSKIKVDPRFQPFWPASRGGGSDSGNGGSGAGSNTGNPWLVSAWNKTEQQSLIVADREKAKALADAAKVSLFATLKQATAAQAKQ